ncbi:hypothetical protein HDA32_003192 [Spinactinospora alkalitolerans]|uniref:Uncharacterized protein n=1 Tax=Spinactinospora alkalitolerans TaxID=687207 RepID=A0A852TYK3_9ACTN|nr:hypothetical protein [Spinactinospora alkalitolerans]NYE48072.1 hypothetical protein [Spinactinospora alkalitolerans]
MRRIEIDPDELRRLYTIEGWSGPRIAMKYQAPKTTIYRHLDAIGIPRRRRKARPPLPRRDRSKNYWPGTRNSY